LPMSPAINRTATDKVQKIKEVTHWTDTIFNGPDFLIRL
jgi:hypothetical protein